MRYSNDYGWHTWWSAYHNLESDDPVYKQCIADAKEYFKNYDLESKAKRKQLSKDDKGRIVSFLKSRKEYYDKNGLVLDKEDE